MTKILAIDTTLGACSAAIVADRKVLATKKEVRARGHVERLLPMIEEVQKEAGIELADVNYIAATIGPGTFAGVRVGLSTAKGLGLALNKPLISVTSLEAIVSEFCAFNPDFVGKVAVAIDARRGEVYLQQFSVSEGTYTPLDAAEALPIENASRRLGDELITALGSGASLVFDYTGLEMEQYHNPSAEYVGICALSKIDDAQSCHEVSPLYLRAPDAIRPAPLKMVVVDER